MKSQRPPGRHRTTTVSCRLEEEYIRQLRHLSERTERTVSWTLRRIVIDALTRRSIPATHTRQPRTPKL